MMQHQPGDHLRLLRRQPQRRPHLQRHLGAQLRMVPAAPLGDVMQQHRHIQRAARLQVIHQPAGHRRDLRQLAALQRVENPHRLDRVLVHREHMIGVELHLPHDPRPVRQQPPQHPGLVHDRQPLRPVGPVVVGVAPAQQVEENRCGLRIVAQPLHPPLVADQLAHRQRMQLQMPVARHLQAAQHLDRLLVELPPGHRQQPPLGQHEALRQQPRIRLPRRRRRP